MCCFAIAANKLTARFKKRKKFFTFCRSNDTALRQVHVKTQRLKMNAHDLMKTYTRILNAWLPYCFTLGPDTSNPSVFSNRGSTTSLCPSDDGLHLVTTGDKVVKVWDYKMAKSTSFQVSSWTNNTPSPFVHLFKTCLGLYFFSDVYRPQCPNPPRAVHTRPPHVDHLRRRRHLFVGFPGLRHPAAVV